MLKAQMMFLLSFVFSLSVYARTYSEAGNSINILKAQIGQKTGVIKKLMDDRDKNKDPKVANQLSAEISKEYASLADLNKQLNLKIDELRLQYPEKTDQTARMYERSKIPTIEELELGLGVDRQLDDLKVKVRKQYPKSDVVQVQETRQPSSVEVAKDKEEGIQKKEKEKFPESERILISK
ncbi:MAG: hypothetical protein AB7O96_13235 [Pseudobdellovibrionaceae bacterium]